MFERYLERARRALFFARYEASLTGSISIEPPHLLLGIFREGTAVTAALLERSGLSADALRSALIALVAKAETSGSVEIPFSPDTRRALTNAAAEADRVHSSGIDSDHLLLGTLAIDEALASMFEKRGVTLDAIRQLVSEQRYDAPPPATMPSPREIQRPHPQPATPVAEDFVFAVRIAPTTLASGEYGSNRSSDDSWTLEGIDLVSALSQIFGDKDRPIQSAADFPLPFPIARIEIDASFDKKLRYDFCVRGRNLDRDVRKDLLRVGIEQYFQATIVREERPTDVYVLTAPNPRFEALTQAGQFGSGGFGMISSLTIEYGRPKDPSQPTEAEIRRALAARAAERGEIGSVSADGVSMSIFCNMLEMSLGKPVVNETGLNGAYNIQLPEGDCRSFFDRLERELGLKLTEARRRMPFIVLRKN